ncbi:HD domain-containing protein [Fundicoccus culcitae]|uniref:HD domain-containing protein n=1 Tax=Fundicoccus culcitae TaxID=2969821 RepID=A0ABY5P511_9LACT|nr:HD domain-containing protein [Fundicoccus culcitae]UUX33661.1 HD domain-containing protein [Fundicoccus culcitae]
MIHPDLQNYFENEIIPQYKNFDGAHQPDHVYQIIENSLEIAADYEVDLDMVYTIAVYHDIGLQQGRQGHEAASRQLIEGDIYLKGFFTEEQIQVMGEAAEDHRASRQEPPRSIYGKIIAEADRDIQFDRVLERCIQFQLSYAPHATMEENYKAVYSHMIEKYGANSYMHFWLNTDKNTQQIKEIRDILADESQFKPLFIQSYQNIAKS